MRSAFHDLLPGDSRTQRRRGLVSESRERLFTPRSHVPLCELGKTPQRVYCPWCKQITSTQVRRADSRTTKKINLLLIAGLGDPFCLSTLDWAQDINHFCERCFHHLAHKPYKGEMRVAQQSLAELPLGAHHEMTELPSDPNHVSELYGDQQMPVQLEAGNETAGGTGSSRYQAYGGRILNPAENGWRTYESSIASFEQTGEFTSSRQLDLLELPTEHQTRAELPGAGSPLRPEFQSISGIRRKPVELGSGRVRSTKVAALHEDLM